MPISGCGQRSDCHCAPAYIDKILKDAKPGGIPVEQPTRFELLFNLKAALCLQVPLQLQQIADEVIE